MNGDECMNDHERNMKLVETLNNDKIFAMKNMSTTHKIYVTLKIWMRK